MHLKEILDRFVEVVVSSYWGGVLTIIAGIVAMIWSYKSRTKAEVEYGDSLYYLGWGGAIGMVITGILIIIGNLLGKM